jgi:uncharacterized protein YukE
VKKRLMLLCLSAGFTPFLAGCVEDVKADEKNKSEEKAKADSNSADGPKKSKNSSVAWTELASDPLIANAVHARDHVAELEEELLQQLDDLRSELASATADPDHLRQSVEKFIELTKSMRQKTMLANEALTSLSEKTAELSRLTRHLAPSYRALADIFRKKARDYSEKKLRDELLQFANDYESAAASIPKRCKAIDAAQKKIPFLKRKTKEINDFLTDTVDFLNTHPGVPSERRDRFSTEFESFAVTFTEWIRVLDELRNALREKAISKVIQESYRKEVHARQKLEEAKREEQVRQAREKDELAKAEQAKRDEQRKLMDERARLVKEREQLALERDHLVKAEPHREQDKPLVSSQPPSAVASTPVVMISTNYLQSTCPPPATCQYSRPCRIRLFPLFRRCQ